MKVAIVCTHKIFGKGGMETVIGTVAKELKKHGTKVKIILRDADSYTEWLDEIDHSYIYRKSEGVTGQISYIKNLRKELRSFAPDVILGVNHAAIPYLKIATLFKKVPIGSWIHFPLDRLHRSEMIKFADFHLAISNGVAEQIKKINKQPDKVHLVYNPIDSGSHTITKNEIPTFIYIGRLMSYGEKRVMDFIDALGKLSGEWKAVIIGSGDITELKEKAMQLGINDKINWAGWQKHPWDSVDKASALVLTSEFEGFGMVLAEALSRGIPCVSSATVGAQEIINHKENGWLYPVGNVGELSRILQKVINNEVKFNEPLQLVQSVKKFSTEEVVHHIYDYLQLYKNASK